MSKTFTFNSIALAGLAGLTVLSAAPPASAKDYEYCLQDYSSGMPECFDTMEQCVATISGGGGSCVRNPYLAKTSASYAYAPKRRGRARRQRTD